MSEYFEIGGRKFVPALAEGETATRPLWRVKHDVERGGGVWRPRLPEVFRIEPDHHIRLTSGRQWLWYRINFHILPMQWRKLLGNELAFCNHGHGLPGNRDYVNRMELDAPNDPVMDQARICGGNVVSGRVDGNKLFLDAIDVRQPLPDWRDVLNKRWLYFYNTTVQADGTIGRFPQGEGADTFTPLFVNTEAYLYLDDLDYIPAGSRIPSPYEVLQ